MFRASATIFVLFLSFYQKQIPSSEGPGSSSKSFLILISYKLSHTSEINCGIKKCHRETETAGLNEILEPPSGNCLRLSAVDRVRVPHSLKSK